MRQEAAAGKRQIDASQVVLARAAELDVFGHGQSLPSHGRRTLPPVIDESFFLTVAGIAMSFAGFAGLMNSLRRRGDTWAPMDLYQLRIIVAYAIATLFGALSTIPLVALFGTRQGVQWLAAVMLIVAAALGVGNMIGDIRLGRGTAVRTRVRAVFATLTILGLVAFFGTALTGELSLYQIALILMLSMPAGTFVYVVARIER